jgi:hypothetical protein
MASGASWENDLGLDPAEIGPRPHPPDSTRTAGGAGYVPRSSLTCGRASFPMAPPWVELPAPLIRGP